MRISVTCGVEYSADLERVKALTIKTISKNFEQKQFNKEVDFFIQSLQTVLLIFYAGFG